MPMIYTTTEMISQGFSLVGWDEIRQNRTSNKKKDDLFKGFYGSSSIVCCQIWEDLQTTGIHGARIDCRNDHEAQVSKFLIACHYLYRYPTVVEQEVIFKTSHSTAIKTIQYFVKKIALLKEDKVRNPIRFSAIVQ